MRFRIILLSLGVVAVGMLAEQARATDYDVFILAGQSNMAGRGKVDSLSKQTHPRVLMLNKANETAITVLGNSSNFFNVRWYTSSMRRIILSDILFSLLALLRRTSALIIGT